MPSFRILLVILVAALAHGQVHSQEGRHPLLDSKWTVTAGAFFPTQSFDLKANGTLPGDEVDFDERVGVEDSETTPTLTARWRFGEKWSVSAQAWATENSGAAILTEDVDWQDLVFRAGTNVGAGIETRVLRLFFGRTLSAGARHEAGVGIGLHWFELEAYLQGDVLTSEGDLNFTRSSVDAAVPLPNIGGWYQYALTDRWLLDARIDWLSASVGDYSGSLWNAAAGVQWQLTEHFGLGLHYQLLELDGDISKDSWRGGAELANHGALLTLTTNW